MDAIIDFPGIARVDAYFCGCTIAADQPPVFEVSKKTVDLV